MQGRPAEFCLSATRLDAIHAAIRAGATPERAFEAAVPYDDRKRRGQFFTPPPIARAMVRWACARGPRTFLDPAVGAGVFPDELRRISEKPPRGGWVSDIDLRQLRRVTTVDTDPVALGVASVRLNGCEPAAEFLQRDFLTLDLDEPYDAIVCNPPYVRHHDAKLPESLFDSFEEQFGERLSRLTNVYCLFLLKIMASLSDRGRAAVITPTEFLNADFGRAVKRILLDSGRLRGFIHFDYASSVFDGIMTTATITLLDAAVEGEHVSFVKITNTEQIEAAFAAHEQGVGATEQDVRPSERDAGGAEHDINQGGDVDPCGIAAAPPGGLQTRTVTRNEIDVDAKWATSQFAVPAVHVGAGLRPLSEFATCNRGIATGANDFFSLSDAERAQWSIPDWAVRPCITKAMHAPNGIYTAQDHAALRAAGKKAWLLDISELRAHEVAAYLAHGESRGLHERYLTRHRRAWYLTEQREPADIWVTTFARGRLRFIHNQAGVFNLTAFHGIYLKPAYRACVDRLMAYFQSPEFDAVSAREHRVYGDGLLKVEPRDVERLLIRV